MKLFGTDGIRGIAGEMLSAGLCVRVGMALGEVIRRRGDVPLALIAEDTRESSDALCAAIASGLAASGVDVYILGVISTPAVAYLTRTLSASAGVMISASHNPYEYNGIKIFGSDGKKLSDEDEELIEELTDEGAPLGKPEKFGKICVKRELSSLYTDYIKGTYGVSLSGMKIAIDSANGAAHSAAVEVFSSLSAELFTLPDIPNGRNVNLECGSTSPERLARLTQAEGCDFGIALDGDGDRCIMCDSCGRIISGDNILAYLAQEMQKSGELADSTVVATVMSNLGLEARLSELGIRLMRASVGDRYVLAMMEEGGYKLGGEESGHIIIRDKATTGDGLLTALTVLSKIKKGGAPYPALSENIQKYPQYNESVAAGDEEKRIFLESKKIKEIIAKYEKEISVCGRLLVRPSGTEPKIRVMTEGADASLALKVCQGCAEEIRRALTRA